jgi:hypothetical protein
MIARLEEESPLVEYKVGLPWGETVQNYRELIENADYHSQVFGAFTRLTYELKDVHCKGIPNRIFNDSVFIYGAPEAFIAQVE